jgi:hypothetical protein
VDQNATCEGEAIYSLPIYLAGSPDLLSVWSRRIHDGVSSPCIEIPGWNEGGVQHRPSAFEWDETRKEWRTRDFLPSTSTGKTHHLSKLSEQHIELVRGIEIGEADFFPESMPEDLALSTSCSSAMALILPSSYQHFSYIYHYDRATVCQVTSEDPAANLPSSRNFTAHIFLAFPYSRGI